MIIDFHTHAFPQKIAAGAIASLGLVIVLHAGMDPSFPSVHHCTPERIARVAGQLPRARIVAAHCGGFGYLDDVERHLVGSGVYLLSLIHIFSIGLPVVKCVRPVSALPFDVHLMIVEPWKYLEAFAKAGADWLTFHLETSSDPGVIHAALQKIQSLGMKAGLSVKPATPPEAIFPFLGGLDLVLVMTVEPGFGNQKMIPECLEKVRVIRQEAERRGLSPLISIDGGVNAATAEAARASGCDIMVAGSAVFGAEEPAQMIRLLRGGNRNG